MERPYRAIALVVIAMTVSACSTLLKDDFESYNVGQSPGGEIPGSPSCDEIQTEGDPSQFAVETANAIAGDKSLSFEPAFANAISQIDFLPCKPANNQQSLRFRWRGRFEGPADSPGVQVRITDANAEAQLFRAYLFFNITRSSIAIGSAGTVNHTVAGDFSRPHSVIARIVPGTAPGIQDKYFVAIVGEGINPNDAAPEGPLSDQVDFQAQEAFLRMIWKPFTNVSETYRVDDVIIERGQ